MAQALEKLNRNISKLQKEISILRSFVIGISGKDREGEYNLRFVRKILRVSSEDAPFVFKNKKSFLKKIQAQP